MTSQDPTGTKRRKTKTLDTRRSSQPLLWCHFGSFNQTVDFYFLFVNRMAMTTSGQGSVEQDVESFGHMSMSDGAGS